MTKKIISAAILVILAFGIVSCKKGEDLANKSPEAKETGVEINITDKNFKAVFVNPGDVLLVELKGISDGRSQWSFREPTSGNYLTLKYHDVITDNDSRISAGEFLSDWKLKVAKEGIFNLVFEYGDPVSADEPTNEFRVKIFSGAKPSDAPLLILDLPGENETAEKELIIAGFAKFFEGTVNYRLNDGEGKEILKGFVTAKHGGPDYGYFNKKIIYPIQKTPSGVLEVFEISAKDGSEINKTRRNIIFNPEMMAIKVYFNNSEMDPEALCDKVFSVDRYIPKTQAVGRAALEQLISGTSAAEEKAGYFSSLPKEGVKVVGLKIENKKAYAEFNQALQEGVGGSCRVSAIRAQISETLKQFSTVDEVIISIDGRVEDILQP